MDSLSELRDASRLTRLILAQPSLEALIVQMLTSGARYWTWGVASRARRAAVGGGPMPAFTTAVNAALVGLGDDARARRLRDVGEAVSLLDRECTEELRLRRLALLEARQRLVRRPTSENSRMAELCVGPGRLRLIYYSNPGGLNGRPMNRLVASTLSADLGARLGLVDTVGRYSSVVWDGGSDDDHHRPRCYLAFFRAWDDLQRQHRGLSAHAVLRALGIRFEAVVDAPADAHEEDVVDDDDVLPRRFLPACRIVDEAFNIEPDSDDSSPNSSGFEPAVQNDVSENSSVLSGHHTPTPPATDAAIRVVVAPLKDAILLLDDGPERIYKGRLLLQAHAVIRSLIGAAGVTHPPRPLTHIV